MSTSSTHNKKSGNNTLIAGIITAIVASLCCITPLLALIGGLSGAASAFSWLEPFRPYLIAVTALVFVFAWYQKLKPKKKKEIECVCEDEEKTPFRQSKTFLAIITIIAGLLTAFPYYSHIFYPKAESTVQIVESENVEIAVFDIEGMTCAGCEENVKNAISKVPGFIEADVDHKTGKAKVKYDKSKASPEIIAEAINETGYTVIKFEVLKNKD